MNRGIRTPKVRLIAEDGTQMGIVDIRDAIQVAEDRGYDLVEVGAQARPPVCKLMDWGKYKYAQKKKAAESKRRQHQMQVKEVKLRPKTDPHDLETKTRQVRQFLEEGDSVKLTLRFRGREVVYANDAMEQLFKVSQAVAEWGTVKSHPSLEGKNMSMFLVPKQARKGSADAPETNEEEEQQP
jgi:translation initiation factor IF-3